MKKVLMVLLALGMVTMLSAKHSDGSGWLVEIAHGVSTDPYESKLPDGVFDVDTLNVDPKDFSKGMDNSGDSYILLGLQAPISNKTDVLIGGRLHARDGISYEVDFTARVIYEFADDWKVSGGGSFGTGNLDVAFDTINFDTGDSIHYPDSMDFQTASFHLGLEYEINNNWSFSTIYEIKEISMDDGDLQNQINWEGPNPINTIAMSNAVSSYQSTTHSLYFALKYAF